MGYLQVICDVIAGALGKEILMLYPITQRAHQFNSISEFGVPAVNLKIASDWELSGAIWDNIVIQFILVLINIFVSLHNIFMPEKYNCAIA